MFEAWEAADSKFKGITAELAKTWDGTMSMFGDTWFQFRNMVMDSGAFDALKIAAGETLAKIQELKENGRLDVWAQNVGAVVVEVVADIIEAVGWLPTAFFSVRKDLAQLGMVAVATADAMIKLGTLGTVLLPGDSILRNHH